MIVFEGIAGMNWKQELDALIESTMALAKDAKREPILDIPVAMKTAEQALADKPNPVKSPVTITSIAFQTSARDEILQRVSNFKAHQEKMARGREDYYLQVKARMMPPPYISPKKNPPR